MDSKTREHRGPITRDATGPSAAEAFVLIAIATILITRLYLQLTGYPQIGGGNLHIAHALYGGALMMLALIIGWMTLGFGTRVVAIVMGGIGFGLFLDEVGKFVTKDNDYFYGPAAEIMYILVVIILVGARVIRDFRPLTTRECLASASTIAADGVARGLAEHRRQIGLLLIEQARAGGAHGTDVDNVQALLTAADPAADRLYRLRRWAPRLVPDFFRSPRWIPVVGWLIVAGALAGVIFGTLGIVLGGYLYDDHDVKFELDGMSPSSFILLVSAVLTAALALPAMIARHRTDKIWPLRWLRIAALIFTFLNALVDFATEGFGALLNMSIGLFTLAILSYQIEAAARAALPEVSPPS
jgi:roadblock/LC7 domain-containing protein